MIKAKKILALLTSAVMAVAALPSLTFAAQETRGNCGVNGSSVHWVLDKDGLLTISGEGRMNDYPSGEMAMQTQRDAPWDKDLVKKIKVEEGVTYIGNNAFYGCRGADSIELPASVEELGIGAIRNCSSITSISLPAGLKKIGGMAFGGCSKLAGIKLPDGLTDIGRGAFTGTVDLKNAKRVNGACYFGNYMIDTESTVSGKYAVQPGTVVIADGVFSNNEKITEVTIPSSVRFIGKYAFSMCSALKTINFEGSEAEWKNVIIRSNNDSLLDADMNYAGGAQQAISVIVNGSPINFDVPPVIIDGTTMLPVRMALEPLGASFQWDANTRAVTITAAGKTVILTVDSSTAVVDGASVPLAKPAMIVDGRTLIPIRFAAEQLGYNVNWDPDTRTVTING